jgi:hypothetical protein
MWIKYFNLKKECNRLKFTKEKKEKEMEKDWNSEENASICGKSCWNNVNQSINQGRVMPNRGMVLIVDTSDKL